MPNSFDTARAMVRTRARANRWFNDPQLFKTHCNFEADFSFKPKTLAIECAIAFATKPIQTVLDFGCGSGQSVTYLQSRLPKAKISAIPPPALANARDLPSLRNNIDILPWNDREVRNIAKRFDLIISFSNLRLADDQVHRLETITQLLSSGGVAYVQDFERRVDSALLKQLSDCLPEHYRNYFSDQLAPALSLVDLQQKLETLPINFIHCGVGGVCGISPNSPQFYDLIHRNDRIGQALMQLNGYGFNTARAAELVFHCLFKST